MESRPFVGRGREVARLLDAVGVETGAGGLALVSGDAGIGKTRLLSRVAEEARERGWVVAVGHCVGQSGLAMPYLPATELMLGLHAELPEPVEAEASTHPALAQLLPGLFPRAAGSASAQALAEAVHACLTRAATERPVLAVVEDVHWADHSSRDLLTVLLTRGFRTPVGLIVSYRADDLHRRHPLHDTLPVWRRLPTVARVDVGPMPDAAIRELIDGAATTGSRLQEVISRAEGNPFFAEELAASSGDLLAENLGVVLRSRIDLLSPAAQRAVQVIAVAGTGASHDLVASVAGLEEDVLEAALAEAVEHKILTPGSPDAYTFRHALLGEAIREALLPGQRIRLHRSLATILAARPGGHPAELARHAAGSGDLATAVDASRRAGEEALRMGGPREALAHFEAAMGWLAQDDPAQDDLVLLAADAALAAGEDRRAAQHIADRLAHPGLATPGDRRARLLAAYVEYGRHSIFDDRLVEAAREAVAITEGRSDVVRLGALRALTEALLDRREWDVGAAVGEEALTIARRLGRDEEAADLRAILARGWGDDPEAIRTTLDELLAEGPPARALVRVLLRRGLVDMQTGDLESALRFFDEGSRLAIPNGRVWAPFEAACRLLAAQCCFELGRLDDAWRRLDFPAGVQPEPTASLIRATRYQVLAVRDAEPPAGLFEGCRAAWYRDALIGLRSLQGRMEYLGRRGRFAEGVTLAREFSAEVDRQWGIGDDSNVRVSALAAGLLADAAASASKVERVRGADEVAFWQARAEATRATHVGAEGPESMAWRARLAAESLRFAWRAGDAVDPRELEAAWQGAVRLFEAYGNAYEVARVRVKLAAFLLATGGVREARDLLDAARSTAAALPSEPLADDADAVAGTAGHRTEAAGELTAREDEVLALLADGLSNGDIAQRLFISRKTASVHVSNIMAKLGAASRGEAVARAREGGLLG